MITKLESKIILIRHLKILKNLWCTIAFICCLVLNHVQGQDMVEKAELKDEINSAFLDAFNSGDQDSILSFVKTYFSKAALDYIPAEDRTYYLLSKYAQHGPLYYSRRGSEKQASNDWLRGSVSNFWIGIDTQYSDNAPLKIEKQSFKIGGAPKEKSLIIDGPLPNDSLTLKLDRYLDQMEAFDLFSGVVYVAKEGYPLFEKAVGWADKTSKQPNRIDTRFGLASITKSITSVAVLRLKDQGKLNLEDPIGMYVPAYPDLISESVTIQDLLTHQSGIELDYFNSFNEAKSGTTDLEGLLELHLKYTDSLLSKYPKRKFPLNEFDYSNEGYDLLGIIIEKITGKSYPEAVRELVLKPAGMINSGFLFPDVPIKYYATPQFSSLSRSTPPSLGELRTLQPFSYPWPSGGMYTTAGDFGRLIYSLTKGDLLADKTFESATTTQVLSFRPPPFKKSGYGYGLETTELAALKGFGHSGNVSGVSTDFIHLKESGYTLVVLSNYSFVGHAVFAYVLDLLTPAE